VLQMMTSVVTSVGLKHKGILSINLELLLFSSYEEFYPPLQVRSTLNMLDIISHLYL